jgi:hypothetical protein
MIYKILEGRAIETQSSVVTNDPPFYTEMTTFMRLEVFRVANPGEVIVFRARLADRPFTLLAETTLEIAESVRYLRSLGFLFNAVEFERETTYASA